MLLRKSWATRKENEGLTKAHPGFNKYISSSIRTELEQQQSAIHTRIGRRCHQIFLNGNFPDFKSVLA